MAAAATLVAHSGAIKVTREDLNDVYTPPGTDTHITVPHSTLVNTIEMELNNHGIFIAKEEYAIQTDGAKLFGVMTLKAQNRDDYSYALGIRASNDKTLPINMVAGARIFVCDNLSLSGDVVALHRKHTKYLNIQEEIRSGVLRAVGKFENLDQRLELLKRVEIDDNRAQAMILQAGVSGMVPLRLLPSIYKNYFEPPHEEFKAPTLFSLLNGFTEAFKGLRPNIAMNANIEIGKKLFDI